MKLQKIPISVTCGCVKSEIRKAQHSNKYIMCMISLFTPVINH